METPFEAILDSLVDAVLCLDDQGRVLYLNGPACRRVQCQAREWIGKPALELPGIDRILPLSVLKLWLQGQELASAGTNSQAAGVGHPAPVEELVLKSIWHEGHRFLAIIFRDLSVQRSMEHAVYQFRKDQAVGQLAGGIAHDFNNILTAVLSHIDLAISSVDPKDPVLENLEHAMNGARRGAELVSKLLAFSRQSPVQSAAINLAELTEQVAFMLSRNLGPQVQIETRMPPDGSLWTVTGDAGQLAEVLLQLGLNAHDALKQSGRLCFSAENLSLPAEAGADPGKPRDYVRLSVEDSGRGMPPEVSERIFEPYFTTKEVARGAGLGLSVCLGIVKEHGGWMQVRSQPFQGTRMDVYLPRGQQSTSSTSAPNPPLDDEIPNEERARILVVDDEEAVRMVIRAVLAFRGYQVTEASDGQEGIEIFRQTKPSFDLVIMDCNLPGIGGAETLACIMADAPSTKAILLSGGVDDRANTRMTALRGIPFLAKPFQSHELLRLVRETLSKGRQPGPARSKPERLP